MAGLKGDNDRFSLRSVVLVYSGSAVSKSQSAQGGHVVGPL